MLILLKKKLPKWNQEDININKQKLSNKDKAYIERNYKVFKDISKNSMQFVNADTGLMASLLLNNKKQLPIKKCEISFDKLGYTKFKDDPNSNINLFVIDSKNNREKFLEKQTSVFMKYLKK